MCNTGYGAVGNTNDAMQNKLASLEEYNPPPSMAISIEKVDNGYYISVYGQSPRVSKRFVASDFLAARKVLDDFLNDSSI